MGEIKKKSKAANLIRGAANKTNHMLSFQGVRNLGKQTLNKYRQETRRHFRQRRQQSTPTEARKCLVALGTRERAYGWHIEWRKRGADHSLWAPKDGWDSQRPMQSGQVMHREGVIQIPQGVISGDRWINTGWRQGCQAVYLLSLSAVEIFKYMFQVLQFLRINPLSFPFTPSFYSFIALSTSFLFLCSLTLLIFQEPWGEITSFKKKLFSISRVIY